MNPPEELIRFFHEQNRFLILSHINPEGDALGSSIALALALKAWGKDVRVYNRDGVSRIYQFLPGKEMVETTLEEADLLEYPLIILDCNSPERVGLKDKKTGFAVVIDHHETENSFGNIKWIEPGAPATGLMVYELIRKLSLPITPEIATNLYTAISIDTGTFRYGNTTSQVLRVAADLVDKGARPAFVADKLYESWTRNRFELLRRMLETLHIEDLKGDNSHRTITVAITHITSEMFRSTQTTSADTENFSNFGRMIEDVDISAMFRETQDGKWKASLRSKGDANVAVVAAALGGGGHSNASGFLFEGSLEDARKKLLDVIKAHLLK